MLVMIREAKKLFSSICETHNYKAIISIKKLLAEDLESLQSNAMVSGGP